MLLPANFRLRRSALPLFVFMAGSPFFLKNFMHTLGHFDIYGCALAIGLLLIPARSIAFVLLAALASMILVLIHHIHLLMYVPTIAVIVVLRYYMVQWFSWQMRSPASPHRRVSACCSSPRNSGERWRCRGASSSSYLQSRMADPQRERKSAQFQLYLVPATYSCEIHDTGSACRPTCGACRCSRSGSGCMPRSGEILCRPDPDRAFG